MAIFYSNVLTDRSNGSSSVIVAERTSDDQCIGSFGDQTYVSAAIFTEWEINWIEIRTIKQVAQLSQSDRASRWVSYCQM